MQILEALEAFNDMDLPNDLLAYNDMGLPNELLQLGREFNEYDEIIQYIFLGFLLLIVSAGALYLVCFNSTSCANIIF